MRETTALKICGIVAEYDPFHLGHKYLISEARKAGAESVIAVMSGSFTQRGDAACMSKFRRAEAAVKGGADLVIELPAVYSLSSAERFANAAVSILYSAGCDTICFGSECGDISKLIKAAIISGESAVIAEADRIVSDSGITFPAALSAAVRIHDPESAKIIDSPNNTLGCAYIRAAIKNGYDVEFHTICRKGVEHNAETPAEGFASASSIRAALRNGDYIRDYLPDECYNIVMSEKEAGHISNGLSAAESAVLFSLRKMTKDDFSNVPDCSGGLGNRLFNSVASSATLDELYEAVKTKRYTMARVKRAVACAVLGITADLQDMIPPYLHILAANKKGMTIVGGISKLNNCCISQSLKNLEAAGQISERFASIERNAYELHCLTMEKPYSRGENRPNIYIGNGEK